MIDIYILTKLVPDIRHIPHDAWDTRRGTLRRNRLSLVPNPLDDRALKLGLDLRRAWDAHLTVFSMGPPAAEELCRRAASYGADDVVLVSDPVCAGADTIATARTLAAALERINARRGSSPFIVVAGVQSPDGDTAQVPIQVASFLSLPIIPYVTSMTMEDGFAHLESISQSGLVAAKLGPGDLPALLTCTDQLPPLPFHCSLNDVRKAAAMEIPRTTAADLGLEPGDVGLAGSPTRVVEITASPSARRAGELVRWPTGARAIQEAMHLVDDMASALSRQTDSPRAPEDSGAPEDPGTTGAAPAAVGIAAGKASPDSGPSAVPDRVPAPDGAVWVLLTSSSDDTGLVSEARRIADAMGTRAVACLSGTGTAIESGKLSRCGAQEILEIDAEAHAREAGHDPITIARAVEEAVRAEKPSVLLIPATPDGRVTAPYLAVRLGAGLTADCTRFEVTEYISRSGGRKVAYPNHLHQIRPALGGNILATIVSPTNVDRGVPQIATVRPGVLAASVWDQDEIPIREFHALKATEGARVASSAVPAEADGDHPDEAAHGDITACKVLVSVGRGAGGLGGIEKFAQPLADAISSRFDVKVELSASRVVVDAGHIDRDRQVGQTGKTVRPDVYIALGISGAIQHRVGMEESGFILAVNADENAPIRQFSNVFVHGRVEDLVPALIAALASE